MFLYLYKERGREKREKGKSLNGKESERAFKISIKLSGGHMYL